MMPMPHGRRRNFMRMHTSVLSVCVHWQNKQGLKRGLKRPRFSPLAFGGYMACLLIGSTKEQTAQTGMQSMPHSREKGRQICPQS